MNLKYCKSKFICVFLIFAFLLQSCTVYQKMPVSIEEAMATNRKILITKTDETKLKLFNIEQSDGKYYGYKKTKGKVEKILLIETDIKTIRILDKKTSDLLTIGTIAISVIGSVFIILISTYEAPEISL